MKEINKIDTLIQTNLGNNWKWIANDLSESEVGGFAYDNKLWSVELLSNDYNTTKYKRLPVCAIFTSSTSPTTVIALASVHLKARNSDNKKADDDDKEEKKDDIVTESRKNELRLTREEVEALGYKDGVASFLKRKALEVLNKHGSDSLAYISILGDFNLSWTTGDPICSPEWPDSKSAWQPLIDQEFRALISEGQATNAHEIMLSAGPHCFDNVLIHIHPQNSNESNLSIAVDLSKAVVAPWPPMLQEHVEGLKAIVDSNGCLKVIDSDNVSQCSESFRKIAGKGIRKSVLDEIFEHGSDHRALTAIFETTMVTNTN